MFTMNKVLILFPYGRPRLPRFARLPSSPDTDGMLAEQLLRLTRRLHRIQSRQLEPIDITPAQFRLLRTVASYDAAPGWRISPGARTSFRAP